MEQVSKTFVGCQLCSHVREHLFTFTCSQRMFGFEHRVNTLVEHVVVREEQGQVAFGAAPLFCCTTKTSLIVYSRCSNPGILCEREQLFANV